MLVGNGCTLIFAARSDKTGSSLKIGEKLAVNVNKSNSKSLLVNVEVVPLPSRMKKREKLFTKEIDFHPKGFDFFEN